MVLAGADPVLSGPALREEWDGAAFLHRDAVLDELENPVRAPGRAADEGIEQVERDEIDILQREQRLVLCAGAVLVPVAGAAATAGKPTVVVEAYGAVALRPAHDGDNPLDRVGKRPVRLAVLLGKILGRQSGGQQRAQGIDPRPEHAADRIVDVLVEPVIGQAEAVEQTVAGADVGEPRVRPVDDVRARLREEQADPAVLLE